MDAPPVAPVPDAGAPATCLNCGTALNGKFCSQCGQRDVPPYPTVRELAIDAFWELSGWDGRFASTLRALVRRPGRLTREFLEGRRARYLSPLRLYLMLSLVYFVIAAAAPNVRLENGKTIFLGLTVTSTVDSNGLSRPERVANAASDALDSRQALAGEAREEALKDVRRAPAVLQPFLRRAIEDPAGFRSQLMTTMPRMLFALLPVFAAIVALFYRGRKYPEHLYFAIHLHAFIFLALALSGVVKFTQIPALIVPASLTAVLVIPAYATMAFRRVYGGSISATLAREAGIGTIYAMVSLLTFVLTIYWVAVMA